MYIYIYIYIICTYIYDVFQETYKSRSTSTIILPLNIISYYVA